MRYIKKFNFEYDIQYDTLLLCRALASVHARRLSRYLRPGRAGSHRVLRQFCRRSASGFGLHSGETAYWKTVQGMFIQHVCICVWGKGGLETEGKVCQTSSSRDFLSEIYSLLGNRPCWHFYWTSRIASIQWWRHSGHTNKFKINKTYYERMRFET